LKKKLQRFGSRIVSIAAETEIPDAASGFRGLLPRGTHPSQPGHPLQLLHGDDHPSRNKRLAISSIPVQVNPKTRESRLFKNSGQHVLKSAVTIVRAYIMYKPLTVFISAAALLFAGAMVPFVRFLYLVGHDGGGARHLQSLLVGAVLMMAAFLALALGVIADLIRINRILTEDALDLQKRQRFASPWPAGDGPGRRRLSDESVSALSRVRHPDGRHSWFFAGRTRVDRSTELAPASTRSQTMRSTRGHDDDGQGLSGPQHGSQYQQQHDVADTRPGRSRDEEYPERYRAPWRRIEEPRTPEYV